MRRLRAAEEKSCEAGRERTGRRPCRPSERDAQLGTALWRGAAMSGDGEAGGGDAAAVAAVWCDSKLRRTDPKRHVTASVGSAFLRGQLNGNMPLHGIRLKSSENGRIHARLSIFRFISGTPLWFASFLASETSSSRRNDYLVTRLCRTWSAPGAANAPQDAQDTLGWLYKMQPSHRIVKELPATSQVRVSHSYHSMCT
jgi:hypothetical protein